MAHNDCKHQQLSQYNNIFEDDQTIKIKIVNILNTAKNYNIYINKSTGHG